MQRVQTRAEIRIYEVAGEEEAIDRYVRIETHPIYADRVVVTVPGAEYAVTVIISDLMTALRRCT